MKIEAYPWKQSQPLAEAYMHRVDEVSRLFEYKGWHVEEWEARAQWLDRYVERPHADRSRLIQWLMSYNRRIGNSKAALEQIGKLEDASTLVVVGGQQAGLFTGPLLVIYKAITIIQSAKEASERLQRSVIPIFWIAGEDHDFEEVNHTYVMSPQFDIKKLKIAHPTGQRVGVSRSEIEPVVWESVVSELSDQLPDSEFKFELLAKLKEISTSSKTLTDFFAQMMVWLFGEQGLVLLDSDDPDLRRIEAPMFKAILEQGEGLNAAYRNGKKDVEELGYEPQAEITAEQAHLFVYHQQERTLLYRTEEGYTDRKKTFEYSSEELLTLTETEPERFSNNVMTRPLMQDYLFPVLGVVLGQGELAYWSLTKLAFREVGLQMPILVPRKEYTLVDVSLQKYMKRYELSFEDIVERFNISKQTWLQAQDTLQLKDRFDEAKLQFADLYSPLLSLVGGINTGVANLAVINRQKIEEQMDYLLNKAQDAYQAQFDASLRHWNRIERSIIPIGKPQERVYNIIPFLNLYGVGWFNQLLQNPSSADKMHHVIYL